MNELRHANDLIDPNGGYITIEEMRHENGNTYWLAGELMERLGYDGDWPSFSKAIKRATKALMGFGIDVFDNIAKVYNADGSEDYRLTRFAAYLVVMNANPQKPAVAAAQAYFVALTRQFELLIEQPNDVIRVAIREEIRGENTRLSGIAKSVGVNNYAYFQNAGYRGMYNMINVQLAEKRGLKSDELLDHMGRYEMAANLFRIEMTEANLQKLEAEGKIGQKVAEQAHQRVGASVRQMVKESTGKNPEELPVERRLPEVRKQLKVGHREMKKIDDGQPVKKKAANKSD